MTAAMHHDDEKKSYPSKKPNEHPLLETATIVGGVVGTVAGAVGGPPGMIAGGAIGTAVGMAAGAVLDREDQRADAHDRALDETIGVSSGDLGERERAVRAMNELEKGAGDDGEVAGAGALLSTEHARLERVYASLVDAYNGGDWKTVRSEWERFERTLRDHMAREEDRVFPAFMEIEPEEATALLAEHSELRRLLSGLGVSLELHAVHLHDVEELLARLRAHAAREKMILYPWVAGS